MKLKINFFQPQSKTGYFVCSYMVLCNNVSPSDAMRNFSVARGHQIERPNYINAIMHHCSNQELKLRIANVRRSRWADRSSNGQPPLERIDGSSQRREMSTSSFHVQQRDSRSDHNLQSVGRGARQDNTLHHSRRRIAHVSHERSNRHANNSQLVGGSIQGAPRSVRTEAGLQRQERSGNYNGPERSSSKPRQGQRNPRSIIAGNDTEWSKWVNKRMNQ